MLHETWLNCSSFQKHFVKIVTVKPIIHQNSAVLKGLLAKF